MSKIKEEYFGFELNVEKSNLKSTKLIKIKNFLIIKSELKIR